MITVEDSETNLILIGKICDKRTLYILKRGDKDGIRLVCVLDIVNAEDKQKFLSGNNFDIVENLVSQSESMQQYVTKMNFARLNTASSENDIDTILQESMSELKKIYEFGFNIDNKKGWYGGYLDISRDLSNECLRICNNV